MRSARDAGGRDDTGTILIIAMVFLLAIGPIVVGLVSLTGSNLLNTVNLQGVRGVEFAADSVVDGSVQALRHQVPAATSNGTVPCPNFPGGASTSVTINGVSVLAECSMSIPDRCTNSDPTKCGSANYFGRNIEFDACLAQTPIPTFAACQGKAIVRALVVFNDVASGCASGYAASNCYGSSWGTGLTIVSWVVQTTNG